jgi:hypothetical protein
VLANQVDDLAVFGGDGDDVLDANGLAAGTTHLREFGGGNPFVEGPSVPNIVSQGLIWGFAVLDGSVPAGSQDGSAAVVLDRLACVRVDRVARSILGVQGR